jgi:hypothetical protein
MALPLPPVCRNPFRHVSNRYATVPEWIVRSQIVGWLWSAAYGSRYLYSGSQQFSQAYPLNRMRVVSVQFSQPTRVPVFVRSFMLFLNSLEFARLKGLLSSGPHRDHTRPDWDDVPSLPWSPCHEVSPPNSFDTYLLSRQR